MKSECPQRDDIGPRLVQVALDCGYSKSSLGRALGVANTTVDGWKNGSEPRVAFVDRVAVLTKSTLMYIIRGVEGSDIGEPPAELRVWRDTMAPHDVSQAEYETLASVRFKTPHPGPQWYAIALAGLRSGPVAMTTAIRRAPAR
jgi:hypothetical protein